MNERLEPGAIIADKYKLLEPIGEGGMGSVWVAEQLAPVKRKVALKLIKVGMDTREILARFDAERQALALMDHTNIAKVFDGGLSESGRPFFVMEFVKGIPITTYCDNAKLRLADRLHLFTAVCHAVQHAHQKGIIHRDLKPSNILVQLSDGFAVPKVIDFGLAKAMHQPLTDQSLHTAHGVVVGSPLYMSPEQAEHNNLDIDTRTDVYSLGVLLYELLIGTTPIEKQLLRNATYAEILRLIKQVEPLKPSKRLAGDKKLESVAVQRSTDAKQLQRMIRGELDWIVMKSLDKERSRRYDSATSLAADISRYLLGEAVLAHPPSTTYRLGKILVKYKVVVVSVSSLLFALMLGTAGTMYGLLQAQAHRREAEMAEDSTLADFRASTDDSIEQLIGSKSHLGPQERTYLENTIARWERFANRVGNDQRSSAIRAEGHFRVAVLWQKLGDKEKARAGFREACTYFQSLADDYTTVPQYSHELCNARLKYGNLLHDLGMRREARTEYLASLDLANMLTEQVPSDVSFKLTCVDIHSSLGVMYCTDGNLRDAQTEFTAAFDACKSLAEQFPMRLEIEKRLAALHNNRGLLAKNLNDDQQAQQEYNAAIILGTSLVDRFPTEPEYRVELMGYRNNLGVVYWLLGEFKKAQEEYKHAIESGEILVKSFPAIPSYRTSLGGTYCNLAMVIRDEGNPSLSLEWFDKAIECLEPVLRSESRDAIAKDFLHISYAGRANAHYLVNQYVAAIKDWDRAIDLGPIEAKPNRRALRAVSQVQAGMVDQAVAEVVKLTANSNWSADQWYNFACIYSIASLKARESKLEYGDKAMAMLEKAVKAGFNDAAFMANDADLDPLRERDDFESLHSKLIKEHRIPTANPTERK